MRNIRERAETTKIKTFDEMVKSENPKEYIEDRLMDRTEVIFVNLFYFGYILS